MKCSDSGCRETIGCIGAVMIILIICGIIAFMAARMTSTDTGIDANSPESQTTPRQECAYEFSELCISQQCKNPNGAQFPLYDPIFVTDKGNGQYCVMAYVDATNSFGAIIRMPYTCTVQYRGGDCEVMRNWTMLNCKFE